MESILTLVIIVFDFKVYKKLIFLDVFFKGKKRSKNLKKIYTLSLILLNKDGNKFVKKFDLIFLL